MDQIKVLLAILFSFSANVECNPDGFTIINPIRFPPGKPYMAIGLNLAIPSQLDQDLSLAFGFEVAYDLPKADEDKELTYPPIIAKRSLERNYVYEILEKRLEKHGFSGKVCLLRSICEATTHSFDGNGILADIVHIILTPSTSNEKLQQTYTNAENYGRTKGHCKKYKKKCEISLISLISVLKESIVHETEA